MTTRLLSSFSLPAILGVFLLLASAVPFSAEAKALGGGFLNVNGLLLDVNLVSRVQVGLAELSNFTVNTDNLTQVALTASQISSFVQAQIIQNDLDGQLISAYQNLTVTVANTATLDTIAQAGQLQVQQTLQ